MSYDDFKDIFMKVLNLHAPMKKKIVRRNNAPFINKTLSKAFMHRSKLKNKYNKNPTESNNLLYKKQRNLCVNLLKKEKKNYYNNLDLKILGDNKKFWQRIKLLFSDKQNILQRNIIIVKKEVIITDKKQEAEKLNNFFIEAVESLEIEQYAPDTQEGVYLKNIDGIVKKYDSHPSILKIKENVKLKDKFLFNDMISDDLKTEISELNPNKASIENDIPAKILIVSKDIVSYYLSNIYNDCKHDNQ